MQLLIRSVVFIILIFLVEFYFFKKLKKSVKNLFSKKPLPKFYTLTAAGYLNLYPVFLIILWFYSAINHIPVSLPQNEIFNYLIIYPFWLTILIVVQCDLFFLIIDLLKVILYPFKYLKKKIFKFEPILILCLTTVFVLYVPANVIYNYNSIQVRRVHYINKDIPEELNNFRLVFISDIHADQYADANRLEKYIKKVNNLHPDLVLVGGDFISSTPDYIQTAAEYVGKIKSKYGIYSCVGDHDNWAYGNDYERSLKAVETALKDHNIEMINNSAKVINIGRSKIKIVFITNTYVEHIKNSTLDKLTSDTTKYNLKILLTHQPRNNVVRSAANMGFDLLLAGHTHGGQITFLFPFLNLTPTLLETKYIRGDFRIKNMLMIVTRGLGMSLVPLRYNSEPEITIINIRKNKI